MCFFSLEIENIVTFFSGYQHIYILWTRTLHAQNDITTTINTAVVVVKLELNISTHTIHIQVGITKGVGIYGAPRCGIHTSFSYDYKMCVVNCIQRMAIINLQVITYCPRVCNKECNILNKFEKRL